MTGLTSDQLFSIIGQQTVENAILKMNSGTMENTIQSLQAEVKTLKEKFATDSKKAKVPAVGVTKKTENK